MEKPTGNGTPSKSGNTKSVIDNVFDAFMTANRLGDILKYYVRLCQLLDLKADKFCTFYNKLKSSIKTWRAAALWKKIDQRARCVSYGDNTICSKTNVLIIGAGPCGLRTAIEAQLLGAKVVVVEKRDRFSRNNVLHLWPFVIEDLKKLGVKKLLGTFCAGSINHISIRQLQCVLVKICLVLGVELHVNTAFEKLITPTSQSGWRAQFKQDDHRLSNYEFDVVVGGFGKKPDVLPGFKRTEFRGKLAIAITANFENRHTEAENVVGEISGVSRIYKPKFFDNLNACTGIDLENIVYYKDDTHYFIMTAKKSSLLKKGVIKRDLQGVQQLLSSNNVDNEALLSYAREAAGFSTNYAFENLPFALNHRNEPDVALFDFTCMHQAESASRIITRNGCKLLCMLVGDSLLEPFWPTGSGCAKGFLSSLDTAWTIREWSTNKLSVFEVLIERESIYHLLPASTAANLHKDLKSYTIDPRTRYINLKKNALTTAQVRHLYDSDEDIYARREPQNVETSESNAMRGDLLAKCQLLAEWISEVLGEDFDVSSLDESKIMCAILHRFRPDLVDYNSTKIFDAESSTINYMLLQQQLGFLPPTAEEVSCFDSNLNLLLLYKMYQQYKDYNPTKGKLFAMRKSPVSLKRIRSGYVCRRSFVDLNSRRSNFFRTFVKSLAVVEPSQLRESAANFAPRANELNKTNSSRKRFKRMNNKMQYVVKSNGDGCDCKKSTCYVHQHLEKLQVLRTLMRKVYGAKAKFAKNQIIQTTNSAISNTPIDISNNNPGKCESTKSSHPISGNPTEATNSLKKVNVLYENDFNLFNISSSKVIESEIGDKSDEKLEIDCFNEQAKPTSASVVENESNLDKVQERDSEAKSLRNTWKEARKWIKTQSQSGTVTSHLTISARGRKNGENRSNHRPSRLLIRSIERIEPIGGTCLTEIEYNESTDRVTISRPIMNSDDYLSKLDLDRRSKIINCRYNDRCHSPFEDSNKLEVSPLCIMSQTKVVTPERVYDRVNSWLTHSDFLNYAAECSVVTNERPNDGQVETNLVDKLTDITSITKMMERKSSDNPKTNCAKCNVTKQQSHTESSESLKTFKKNVNMQVACKNKKHLQLSPWNIYYGRKKARSEPSAPFTTIVETDEIVKAVPPAKDKLGGSTPKAIVNGHVPNGAGDQPKSILVRCHKKRHVCICKKRKEQTKLFDLRPICSDMFNIMKETVVTAFILFAMDFICNAEQYGFNNVFNIFVT